MFKFNIRNGLPVIHAHNHRHVIATLTVPQQMDFGDFRCLWTYKLLVEWEASTDKSVTANLSTSNKLSGIVV